MPSIDFQIVLSGTTNVTSTVVGPGSTVMLDLLAVQITAEAGVQANLDSFTYRTVFPNELFTLTGNSFDALFDNDQVPMGFNGSIPWFTGAPILIDNGADAGSPANTPIVADLYRTTATEAGVPAMGPNVVLETLSVEVPMAAGVYPVDLMMLEAADVTGAFHSTTNGDSFVITVPEPTTLALLGLGALCLRGRRKA